MNNKEVGGKSREKEFQGRKTNTDVSLQRDQVKGR